ncbi:MAG: PTS glucose transporter subunit IIA [Faecousia sp.]
MGLFDFLKKKTEPAAPAQSGCVLLQPMDGKVIPLEEIGDGVFSSGVLGNGCGLIPSGEAVYAPVSGTVGTVAETKHAVGIETADGAEILIHVGLETVSMNGEGFDVKVKEGDKVEAGQLLMTFSQAAIEAAEGVSTTSAFLVTNSDDFPGFQVLRTGEGKVGDELIRLK